MSVIWAGSKFAEKKLRRELSSLEWWALIAAALTAGALVSFLSS